jgi:hypothetical protein
MLAGARGTTNTVRHEGIAETRVRVIIIPVTVVDCG